MRNMRSSGQCVSTVTVAMLWWLFFFSSPESSESFSVATVVPYVKRRPQALHWCHTRSSKIRLQLSSKELENEEPLDVMFKRAVVLQRSGSHPDEALREYGLFLKAAKQIPQVEPHMYAEVYGNMGALYLKLQNFEEAQRHLTQALEYRPKFGTAHVNLAVVCLQQATANDDGNQAFELINRAQQHCEKALECNSDPRSVGMAQKLLTDIDQMLSKESTFE